MGAGGNNGVAGAKGRCHLQKYNWAAAKGTGNLKRSLQTALGLGVRSALVPAQPQCFFVQARKFLGKDLNNYANCVLLFSHYK